MEKENTGAMVEMAKVTSSIGLCSRYKDVLDGLTFTKFLEVVTSIVKAQNDLNIKLCGSSYASTLLTEPNKRKIRYGNAMLSEGVELLDSVNWKHWKKDSASDEDIDNIETELVDIAHFTASVLLVWAGRNDFKLFDGKGKCRKEYLEIVEIAWEILNRPASESDSVTQITAMSSYTCILGGYLNLDGVYNEDIIVNDKPSIVYPDFNIGTKTNLDHITIITGVVIGFMFKTFIEVTDGTITEFLKLYLIKNAVNELRERHGYGSASNDYYKYWDNGVEDNSIAKELILESKEEVTTLEAAFKIIDTYYKDNLDKFMISEIGTETLNEVPVVKDPNKYAGLLVMTTTVTDKEELMPDLTRIHTFGIVVDDVDDATKQHVTLYTTLGNIQNGLEKVKEDFAKSDYIKDATVEIIPIDNEISLILKLFNVIKNEYKDYTILTPNFSTTMSTLGTKFTSYGLSLSDVMGSSTHNLVMANKGDDKDILPFITFTSSLNVHIMDLNLLVLTKAVKDNAKLDIKSKTTTSIVIRDTIENYKYLLNIGNTGPERNFVPILDQSFKVSAKLLTSNDFVKLTGVYNINDNVEILSRSLKPEITKNIKSRINENEVSDATLTKCIANELSSVSKAGETFRSVIVKDNKVCTRYIDTLV